MNSDYPYGCRLTLACDLLPSRLFRFQEEVSSECDPCRKSLAIEYFGASQGRSWTEHYSLRRRYMRIPRARLREPLWKKKVPNPKKKRLPETILSSNNHTEPT